MGAQWAEETQMGDPDIKHDILRHMAAQLAEETHMDHDINDMAAVIVQ